LTTDSGGVLWAGYRSRRRLRLFLVDATVVYIVVTAATGAARQPKNLRLGYENFAAFLAGSRIVFPP